jgi:hypothetical protein
MAGHNAHVAILSGSARIFREMDEPVDLRNAQQRPGRHQRPEARFREE